MTTSNRQPVEGDPLRDHGQANGKRGLTENGAVSDGYRQMLERRAAQLTVLNRVGEALFAQTDPRELLELAARLLHIEFGHYYAAIYTLDPQNGGPILAASAGSLGEDLALGQPFPADQGLVSWVFRQQRPILVNDAAIDPRLANPFPERIPTRAEMAVPIQTGGRFYGVIDVQSPQVNAFEQDDLYALEGVARQLALGIENNRLYSELNLRLEQQTRAEGLMRLQRDMLAGLSYIADFHELLDVIMATLTRVEGIDCGSIYIVDETGGMSAVVNRGLTPAFVNMISYLPPEAHKTQYVMQGKPLFSRYYDLNLDPRIPSDIRDQENMRSIGMLPISYQGKVIANLTVGSHTLYDIPEEIRGVLQAIAAQLGAVIARLKSDQALAASKAYSLALLAAAPDPILVVDSQGILHNIHPGNSRFAFVFPPNLLGKSVYNALPPDSATWVQAAINTALSEGKPFSHTYHLPCNEEHGEVHLEINASPLSEDRVILIIRAVVTQNKVLL